jgi:hypothetical protein
MKKLSSSRGAAKRAIQTPLLSFGIKTHVKLILLANLTIATLCISPKIRTYDSYSVPDTESHRYVKRFKSGADQGLRKSPSLLPALRKDIVSVLRALGQKKHRGNTILWVEQRSCLVEHSIALLCTSLHQSKTNVHPKVAFAKISHVNLYN